MKSCQSENIQRTDWAWCRDALSVLPWTAVWTESNCQKSETSLILTPKSSLESCYLRTTVSWTRLEERGEEREEEVQKYMQL